MNHRHIVQFDSIRQLYGESNHGSNPPSSTDQRAADSSPATHPPSSLGTALALNVVDAHASEALRRRNTTITYFWGKLASGDVDALKHLRDVSGSKIDVSDSRLQIPSRAPGSRCGPPRPWFRRLTKRTRGPCGTVVWGRGMNNTVNHKSRACSHTSRSQHPSLSERRAYEVDDCYNGKRSRSSGIEISARDQSSRAKQQRQQLILSLKKSFLSD
ncbi:hypothetical protein BDR22DRAFT_819830 [Usnea florida]